MKHCTSAVLLFFLWASVSYSDGWPTLGGNSEHNGLGGISGPGDTTILWTETDWGCSFGGDQVYIQGDTLVTMRFRSPDDCALVVYCISSQTLVWSTQLPGAQCYSMPIGYKDGRIYAVGCLQSTQDTVYALNPVNGDIIWKADRYVYMFRNNSAAFTTDDDIIVHGLDSLYRIDCSTGQRVWAVSRIMPVLAGPAPCVHDTIVYGWEGSITTPKVVVAYNANTGVRIDSSDALPGDGDQEIPFMVGPEGTVYAARDGGELYALKLFGTTLTTLWHRPIRFQGTWSQSAIDRDGNVIVADSLPGIGNVLLKLDPATGNPKDTSVELILPNPRISVGANGMLYVSNGDYSNGRLYVLTPDLDTLWSVAMPAIYFSGPALQNDGSYGYMAVSCLSFLRIYRSLPVGLAENYAHDSNAMLAVVSFPNPFRNKTILRYGAEGGETIRLAVYNTLGQKVRSLVDGCHDRGVYSVCWDRKDDDGTILCPGIYFCTFTRNGQSHTLKITAID